MDTMQNQQEEKKSNFDILDYLLALCYLPLLFSSYDLIPIINAVENVQNNKLFV